MDIQEALGQYIGVIRKCRLFTGIPEELYPETLRSLQAKLRHYGKGEIIRVLGDDFPYAYYLLRGEVELSFFNRAYNQININRFLPGSLMGEALAFLRNANSPVQLTAVEESLMLLLDLSPLSRASDGFEYGHTLTVNLARLLAGKNVFLNSRLHILAQKGVRDRILMYLSSLPKRSDGYVTLPFTKTALAEFLCVNRSALSREFTKMAEEGILEIEGRRVKPRFRES
ncbi:Crp/Fnr family transcriptional regulator [Synergistes jonesii]|uniref:Crp/Fnr family transcriptional regulator n=1 Tax=Synergistes jonesii TaxID=2754 RepID=UPI00248E650A|nr:Crp/Fnr family transcriptional regulator [Synergistes jonesii]